MGMSVLSKPKFGQLLCECSCLDLRVPRRTINNYVLFLSKYNVGTLVETCDATFVTLITSEKQLTEVYNDVTCLFYLNEIF